jgi:GNAT superfamily N-acetyltransferase
MDGRIRNAEPGDVPRLVELSEQKRIEYERYQPTFWRKAADSRERQTPFLAHQIRRENVIALVHEVGEAIDGFIIATLMPAPPVYDPGGLTCLIDDFAMAEGSGWQGIGAALLREVRREAAARGAVQAVVVCGHRDSLKREMLAGAGFTIASEWYVTEI